MLELQRTLGSAVRRVAVAARQPLIAAGFAVGLPLVLVLAWALATRETANIYFPSPAVVADAFTATWLTEATMTKHVLPSLGRFGIGVALSIVIGIVAGTAIGATPWLRSLLEPMLEFFRAIPPVALVPVLMLILGIDDSMKLAVIVSGSVWPVLLNTIEGVRAMDPVLTDTTRSYRIRGRLAYRYFILPAASPQIMAGVRLCLSIGLILMVISEMFAASSGLGYQILFFQRQYMIAEMWSGIVLLGIVGVAVAAIFQLVERRVLHWYHGSREVSRG